MNPEERDAPPLEPETVTETVTQESSEPVATQTPAESEKDQAKVDPIRQIEDTLAAEESLLTPDQLQERYESSQKLRAQANNLYKDSAFNDAAMKYSEALKICPLKNGKDRSILHANRAAALMGNHQNREALPDLDRALQLDPHYLKALERRARLNKLLENLDDSLKDYEKILELRPGNCAHISTIRELKEQIRKRDEELKAKMMDSLKQLGNVFLKPFGLSTDNFSMVPNEAGGYSVQMNGQK
ncbi:tetratricopeptide repeat protein 1 [Galendromus occidentalis]|uniref:Tetratricopeptide repeat protein 1 n=1 Tax=Galendromus occidentalis TaxID=34638 RepID=A0AAJ6VVW3_9ACAR|nr:tetratricopeptide repeat protein 1 [Galendromus occidentalis]